MIAPEPRYLAQQVHIAGPHLMDCSLPYDLWTHEAEFAATVYLILERPDLDAATVLPDLIKRYNESNRRIGVETRPFHATLIDFKIRLTQLFIASLEPDASSASAYTQLLSSRASEPFFALNFYSRSLLFSQRAHSSIVKPDRMQLSCEALRTLLWGACA